MRTASAIEAPLAGVAAQPDPQLWIARLVGAALAAAVFISLLPHYVLPNGAPLAAVLGAALAVLATRNPDAPYRYDIVTPVSVLFSAVGMVYVALSALQALPVDNLRPVRPDFIPRHAYYVVLWLPIMAGTTSLFHTVFPQLVRFARAAALPLLATISVADFFTGMAFGQNDYAAEGYLSFLDPATVTFLYAACFFLHVGATRRVVLPLTVATLHYLASNLLDYGMMFNTLTGTFVLACMWIFGVCIRRSPRLALGGVLAAGTGLIASLMIGITAPEALGFDLNTQWRFLVWRENLFASLETGLVGVGFGTSYFPLSAVNITDAFKLVATPEFAVHAGASPVDVLYVRGQHSSYVNAFYRMGLAGGALLIAFNVAMLTGAWQAVRRGNPERQALALACGAVFMIESTLIAMHVGLESPRYFAMYALAVGLSRAATRHARQGGDA